jgi:hypothetical protein
MGTVNTALANQTVAVATAGTAAEDQAERVIATLQTLGATIEDNATATKTLVATMKGVISPSDSRKLIEGELWDAAKELIRGFRVSLRENHYAGRESKVRGKMIRAGHKIIHRIYLKLSQFDMAVPPRCYFPETENVTLPDVPFNTCYTIVLTLWDRLEGSFRNPINYNNVTDAAERDQLVTDIINSVVRDAIAAGIAASESEYRATNTSESDSFRPPTIRTTRGIRTRSESGLYIPPEMSAVEPLPEKPLPASPDSSSDIPRPSLRR